MLVASGLTKSFGRVLALDDFGVTLERGRVALLAGPNGSGKTTFLKCALGLVRPDRGFLTLDGANLLARPAPRARIGYMPQIGRFPDHLSIAAILRLLRSLRAPSTARFDEELIEAFGLREIEGKAARTLSGGTRQKLSACLAFLPGPEVLILDEPTAGLDPVAAEILIAKIRQARDAGKLVILTSHVFGEFDEVATEILCLIDGRLQFHRRVDELRAEHKGMRLGGIVAALMKESSRLPPPPR